MRCADLDRELIGLKTEEQKLIREIKAAAKANNQASMKILAKSLVRLRAQMTKLQGSAANLKGVSTNLTVSTTGTLVRTDGDDVWQQSSGSAAAACHCLTL
eukprot:GHUV01025533.1.p2 GENE.GHUV01025533.1~~GHUV01025533.1.p2  ORF type:complete len:101 (-),score=22.22 GHUV01025533.1:210-512(-)